MKCVIHFQCDEAVKQCEQYMSAYKLLRAEQSNRPHHYRQQRRHYDQCHHHRHETENQHQYQQQFCGTSTAGATTFACCSFHASSTVLDQ